MVIGVHNFFDLLVALLDLDLTKAPFLLHLELLLPILEEALQHVSNHLFFGVVFVFLLINFLLLLFLILIINARQVQFIAFQQMRLFARLLYC